MVETSTVSGSEHSAVSPFGRTSDLLLIEVAKLQSDGEYLKRDVGEVRTDIREIRSDIKDLRGELNEFRGEVRSEIQGLRGEIQGGRGEVKDIRGEVRGLGERVTRLEERVAHLPGKGFIVVVVSTALVLVGAVTTIVPRLQTIAAPAAVQPPQSIPR